MTHIGYIAGNQYDRYIIEDQPKLVHEEACTVHVKTVEYAFGHIRFSMKFASSMFSLEGFFIEASYEHGKIHFSPPGMITISDNLFRWLEESYRDIIMKLPEMIKRDHEEKDRIAYERNKMLVEKYESNKK